MGCRSLAEAVILQSMEDLWSPYHREESKEFFKGEGFKIFAKIADLNSLKQLKITHISGGKNNDRTVRANRA
ncbi:MAG: hypothetical protein HY757_06570 [Nitrospirae bacterium]|nr:hypothetical protein [Nitrospirota bacterium]